MFSTPGQDETKMNQSKPNKDHKSVKLVVDKTNFSIDNATFDFGCDIEISNIVID